MIHTSTHGDRHASWHVKSCEVLFITKTAITVGSSIKLRFRELNQSLSCQVAYTNTSFARVRYLIRVPPWVMVYLCVSLCPAMSCWCLYSQISPAGSWVPSSTASSLPATASSSTTRSSSWQSSTSSIDTCSIPALRSPFQTHKMNLPIVACQRSCIRWVLPIQCTTVTCKEAGVAHKLISQHCLPNKICT